MVLIITLSLLTNSFFTEEGTLYGWGKNKFSQFPFDSKTTANSKPPTKLFLGLNEIIIDVQLGVFDIYCLTSNVAFLIKTVESGKVVTWACKALSLMSSENVHVPTFVKLDDTIAQMYVTPESVICKTSIFDIIFNLNQ